MQQPINHPAEVLGYGRSCGPRWISRHARGFVACGVVLMMLVAGSWTVERRTYVDYSLGVIGSGVYVAGVPVHTTERSVLEGVSGSGSGGWRLMVATNVWGWKEETREARVTAHLRMTLEAIWLGGAEQGLSELRKRELIQAAWNAASGGDLDALKAIRTEAGYP